MAEGTKLHGSDSAWDTDNNAGEHAADIENATYEYHTPLKKLDGATAPTVDEDSGDGYAPGSYWVDVTNDRAYICLDASAGAAVWQEITLPDPFAFRKAATTLTISGGSVTATQTLHIIAAETGTEDDLDTISGLTSRQLLLIQADSGDTITVKHGTGNVHFDSGVDFDLAGDSWLLMFYDGTNAVALGAGGSSDAEDTTYTPAVSADWDAGDPGNVDDALDELAERVTDNEALVVSAAVQMIFSQIVDVEVDNTTTQTSILGAGRGSKTVPANTLDVGTVIRITLAGHLSDSGAPTLDLAIELGGTEVCSTGAQTLNNAVSDTDWHATIDIVCRSTGATGTVVASGLFEHDDDAQFRLVKTSATTIDTTSALLVDALVTWGTAHADNSIVCQTATVELIKADNLAVAAPSGLTATEV